jgi:hypothetical protein
MFRPCPMGHTLSPVYIFHDLLYIKASATRVRVAMARLREREREIIKIREREMIKKNASF